MTSSGNSLRILFRAPAGARRGFGHLVRCLSLARALGVRPLVALRGPQTASDIALALGADLVTRPCRRTLRALAPDVVVIDDPIASHARGWIRAARRAGALVVTIHDRGLGCPEGDLLIDGSAVLDPRIRTEFVPAGRNGSAKSGRTVVIALGGGPHAQAANAIAEAIVAADPEADVRIVAGFVAAPRPTRPRVRWNASRRGLAPELTGADVAIVGGGMSLYETCAMGVPAVAMPVVAAQTPTVRALAERGAVVALPPRAGARGAAEAALDLLGNPRRRAALARRASQLVDGLGAWRAAAAVVDLAHRGQLS
jgi:spore coat polysaccharide biosynthesis predicted glycosyltransferase SpsG